MNLLGDEFDNLILEHQLPKGLTQFTNNSAGELEDENRHLKQMYAALSLENRALTCRQPSGQRSNLRL